MPRLVWEGYYRIISPWPMLRCSCCKGRRRTSSWKSIYRWIFRTQLMIRAISLKLLIKHWEPHRKDLGSPGEFERTTNRLPADEHEPHQKVREERGVPRLLSSPCPLSPAIAPPPCGFSHRALRGGGGAHLIKDLKRQANSLSRGSQQNLESWFVVTGK